MAINNIYSAALMEHNSHPDYKYQIDDPDFSHQGVNPSCGDDITLSMNVKDGVIDEIAFTGSGCAVSQSSADIMSDLLTDKTVDEAYDLCDLFLKMIRGEVTDDAVLSKLGEAAQLKDISHMPARVKCAELGWRTAMSIIDDQIRGKKQAK